MVYHFFLLKFLSELQTANLDGETNLKIRKALERTWDYLTPEKAAEFKGLTFLVILVDILSLWKHRLDRRWFISCSEFLGLTIIGKCIDISEC